MYSANSTAFLKVYQKSIQRLEQVAEKLGPSDTPERTPEHLVSAIWFDQQLDHDNLRLIDGKKLAVLSPGRWNAGPGPDFNASRIRIAGGPTLDGDIEVHVFASEWDRHKHADDPRYANVVLNVCMWNDLRRPDKFELPVLELFSYLADEQILTGHKKEGYPYSSATMKGKCAPLVDEDRLDKVLHFLAAAGDARIQRKSERMASLARTFGYDQTLYKGLMEAAGYTSNKQALSHLADVMHLELLRTIVSEQPLERRQKVILALLYGCSGLFDSHSDDVLATPISSLRTIWNEINCDRQLTTIRGIKLTRSRPTNNPYRRMAAISHLLGGISGLKLFDYFLAALGNVKNPAPSSISATGRRLRDILTSQTDPYWDTHVSISSGRPQKATKLIGQGLASIIVANILLPLMLAYSRQKQHWNLEVFLHQLYSRFGGQPHNALTRFTCSRILGSDNLQPRFATNARLHQGLLQVYYDFCRSLRKGCEECDLVDFLVEKGY